MEVRAWVPEALFSLSKPRDTPGPLPIEADERVSTLTALSHRNATAVYSRDKECSIHLPSAELVLPRGPVHCAPTQTSWAPFCCKMSIPAAAALRTNFQDRVLEKEP